MLVIDSLLRELLLYIRIDIYVSLKHVPVYPLKVKVVQSVLVYCREDFKGWFKVYHNVHSKYWKYSQ